MRLPQFNELAQSKEMLEEFGGYNHNLRINNGEWYDQKNMCTDYYPMASTRNQRALFLATLDSAQDITFTYNSATYTIKIKALDGCTLTDGNIVTLHKVEKNGSDYGLWFIRNGHVVGENYPAQIVEKAAYFDIAAPKHNIVKMASYICVLPDGVVYETENTTDAVPVFSVAVSRTYATGTGIFAWLTKKNSDGQLVPISAFPKIVDNPTENAIRYKDGAIQEYIVQDDGSGMWVGLQTYVRIYKEGAIGLLPPTLKANDVVQLSTNEDADNIHADIFSKTSKIINKTVSGAAEYIDIEGFVLKEIEGESTYTTRCEVNKIERKMPVVSNIGFAAQNRLWCCDKDGHEYYASALGDPYNFYDFSHLSTDSFAQNVLTDGAWTGGVSYNDMPIFFKENAAHLVQGYYPINDGVQDGNSYADRAMTDFRGCESGSNKSFAMIDNILYYKSRQGIVAFDGVNTTLVSAAFGNVHYKNVIAIRKGDKYYAAMKDDGGQSHIFAYDTKKGMWSKEDNLNVDFAISFLGVAAFVGKGADIPNIPTQLEQFAYMLDVTAENMAEVEGHLESDYGLDIDWMCESGVYGYSYPNNKYISRFQIRLQIAAGATASVYIQYDSDGVWHKKGEFSNKGTKTYLLPIVPQRCDHMKLKFEGKGDVKIISIAKILEEGGDV